MSMVTIKINNQIIQCQEGETIVDVARKHNIFIPTICYLGGCSPTLACKMCMGENGDGKRVYTCNTKAKEGLEIFTNTPQIERERQMIMQTYDVNHPLECGVCDKSGECELQNLTLYTKVAHQEYALRDDEKHSKAWAQALYDPNLCIVCERCVTTCKDNIGEAKLKAGKADLHAPDSYKDSMLKDPYSVWSKKQKSLIEFVGDTPCVDCGECIAVCPVGALTYKDFSYSANAWELTKTPSTCSYCSMGCHIVYETRHYNSKGDKRIYRVTNDFHYAPICGAGRFGFSVFSNPTPPHQKDSLVVLDSAHNTQTASSLSGALEHLKNAKALRLGDNLTNEEAMIAQILATYFGLELYNENARAYQKFLPFLQMKHTLQDLKDSSTIITLGCAFRLQVPLLQYVINNMIRIKKGVKLFYMHPVADALIASFSRSIKHIAYKPSCEEVALGALLLAMQGMITESSTTNASILAKLLAKITSSAYINAPKVDSAAETKEEGVAIDQPKPTYKVFEEAGIAFDMLQELGEINLSQVSLIVGDEAILHTLDSDSALVEALYLLESCGVKVFVVPSGSNVAGIARICTLSKDSAWILDSFVQNLECTDTDCAIQDSLGNSSVARKVSKDSSMSSAFTIGIRALGDVIWDCEWNSTSSFKPDFCLPSHQQMNATTTNFENRVLPFKAAIAYNGYTLADIAHYVLQNTHSIPSAVSVGTQESCASELDSVFEHFANYTTLSDYTRALPSACGFAPHYYDELSNYYTQGGEDKRGYLLVSLKSKNISQDILHKSIDSPLIHSNYNAYVSYPQNIFSIQTVLDSNLQQKDGFYTSKAHLQQLGLQEGQSVEFVLMLDSAPYKKVCANVYIDYGLGTDIWLLSPNLVPFRQGCYFEVQLELPHSKEQE